MIDKIKKYISENPWVHYMLLPVYLLSAGVAIYIVLLLIVLSFFTGNIVAGGLLIIGVAMINHYDKILKYKKQQKEIEKAEQVLELAKERKRLDALIIKPFSYYDNLRDLEKQKGKLSNSNPDKKK